jgi:lysozyme
MNYVQAEMDLIKEEGLRLCVYKCTAGHPTIGVGHKLAPQELRENLREVSLEWAGRTLHADIALALGGCSMIFGRERFDAMAEPRQRTLMKMVFQMGTDGVMRFRKMCAAIMRDDWATAAAEALDSKWAKSDSPIRARRAAEVLRTGRDK